MPPNLMPRLMPFRRCALLLTLIVGGLLAPPVRAQLSDAAQVSLITVLPGDDIYALWGHSAFRVYDPVLGIDEAYNYGTFDFGNPATFVLKFAYGDLRYKLDSYPYPLALRHYREREKRPVIEQVLNLNAAQRDALYQFLETNLRPENRYYQYDFLFDNCATRPRDVLKAVLGDTLDFSAQPDPGRTFRELLNPFHVSSPFTDFGIDLLLGARLDRNATPWQTMFLPLYLAEAFDHATVQVDGRPQPLVARRDTVFWLETNVFEPAPPWPALLLWSLLAAATAATILSRRRNRDGPRWPDAVWLAFAGTAGVVIAVEWFISLHTVTENNWNLLWAWPTHLAAAYALARGHRGPLLRGYLTAAAVVSLCVALGWTIWPQALHPAFLPLLLLMALRGGWLALRLRAPAALPRTA